MDRRVEIAVPPMPEYVSVVRRVIGAFGAMEGLDQGSVDDLRLAVSEALTNAVTREARAATDEPIRVAAQAAADRGVAIEVVDAGPPVDQARIDAPDEPASDEFSFETGLSLPVLRGLADEVSIAAGPEGGLAVSFTVTH